MKTTTYNTTVTTQAPATDATDMMYGLLLIGFLALILSGICLGSKTRHVYVVENEVSDEEANQVPPPSYEDINKSVSV